jgi:hypothetical protein
MPTDENKMLAKFMRNTFGINPNARIVDYLNEDESTSIPILSCPESPYKGLTTYATIGLSDYPMYHDNKEFDLRVEIVGVGDSSIDWFPNILSTSAFYVIQKGWLYSPGAVVENLVSMYEANTELKHIYFTSPFLWSEQLKTLQLETKKVAWLLSILITDSEYQYLKQHGSDKFEELLEERDADVFNIARNSVI